jgi:hypothetical protein
MKQIKLKGWVLLLACAVSLPAMATDEVTMEGYTPPTAASPDANPAANPVADSKESPSTAPSTSISSSCADKIISGTKISDALAKLGPKFAVISSGKMYSIGASQLEYSNDGTFVSAFITEDTPDMKKIVTDKMKLSEAEAQAKQPSKVIGKFFHIGPADQKDPNKYIDVVTDTQDKITGFTSGISCE